MSARPQVALVRVPALDCPDELALIEKGLRPLAGVGQLVPDYLNRMLRVEHDPALVAAGDIAGAITAIGFPAELATREAGDAWTKPRVHYATLAGGILLALAAAVQFIAGNERLAAALAVASAIASGLPVGRAAWRAIRLRALDMNALMTIAAVGAIATEQYFEAATALFLFGISLWLESFSMNRARRAVQSLVELTPLVAHRLGADGSFDDVTTDLLTIGERVLVRPGERVPVDGLVLSGESSVNQAPITGESVPVDKSVGERVFAGSLNGEGSLEIRVTRLASESTLAHAARLVSQAQASRSPTERFVDRFARIYTPVVIVLAVLLAAVPPLLAGGLGITLDPRATALDWFHRALVLLVIACPCALVISTPITIVCGLFAAARRGMLIKGGEHLESAGRIDALAIDKTGTLTKGELRVARIEPSAGYAEADVLRLAAALEQHSEHPLAEAIVAAARERGLELPTATEFSVRRGFGVEGFIDGVQYRVGSARHLREAGVPIPAEPAGDFTAVFIATDSELLGAIELADAPRDDARAAIAELKRAGIHSIAMLTGDRSAVAKRLAAEVGVDEIYADLLPEDKVAVVRRLAEQRPHLAMVGDGVNDAPALAAAKLGIALGTQSSDTALETADVVILAPKLMRLAELFQLGRRTRQLLAQNIAFALAAKAAVLLLAAAGYATLWMAVAADVGASLVVIANGMRTLAAKDATGKIRRGNNDEIRSPKSE